MEFRILGPLEIVEDGSPVDVPGARERALLAYLLLHANQVVATDLLLDEFWPESPADNARNSLRVRVSRLRNALGGEERIVTRQPGYMLRVGAAELDLARFEELTSRAEAVGPADSAELLRAALELWRGEPLADFAYEDFAQPAIQRLREIRLVALERRIDADLALGRAEHLVPELHELVSKHPLRERLRAQLMISLYQSGRQGEALDAYREARRALIEALGIEPGAALRGLEQAILRQDASLTGTPAVGMRSILVLVREDASHGLFDLAATLAASPRRELILVQTTQAPDELATVSAMLEERRNALLARGADTRAAAFTSDDPATDVLRVATEQNVDLILLDAPAEFPDQPLLSSLFAKAPCDVGSLIPGEAGVGPVLVPFTGAEHDWAAIEIAAWAARAREVTIRLAGPTVDPTGRGRDASRLLANASIAVQRALGVTTEPLLVAPDPSELVRAASDAGLVVLGLSERWQAEDLGEARGAIAREAASPVLVTLRGLRPGGLAPPASHTRFTWTIRG